MLLVTGSSGFIGRNLSRHLPLKFKTITREPLDTSLNTHYINSLDENTCWADILVGVDSIVHLAGVAHTTGMQNYNSINNKGTVHLALEAAKAGVKRFVFVSTIGVNGTSNDYSFKFDDMVNPSEEYSVSKYKAELGLKKIAKDTDLEVVIIRPPLVYGKNAPGNFGTLLKVAEKNLPLPLGAINNQRSFVAIDNLVDLIITCIEHPDAANQTFLVSDDENISTSNLLKKLTLAAGKKPWLLPVPVSILTFLASIVGKKAAVERFSSSLTVDIEHTKKILNWKPPITLDEGIRRCFK